VGITTNPTIFQKAISGSDHYVPSTRCPKPLCAVPDHGVVRDDTIRGGYDDAAAVMAPLEHDGLATFQTSWAALAKTMEQNLAAATRGSEGEEDPP
jgi:transaldolase